jgi:hypothetical protein
LLSPLFLCEISPTTLPCHCLAQNRLRVSKKNCTRQIKPTRKTLFQPIVT